MKKFTKNKVLLRTKVKKKKDEEASNAIMNKVRSVVDNKFCIYCVYM